MNSDFSDILADVKEQILYLQELGVENLAVDLPEIMFADVPVQPQKQTIPQEKLERFVPVDLPLPGAVKPPQRSNANEAKPSRSSLLESTKLSRLPSLPKRDSIYTNYQEPKKPIIQPTEKEMPTKKTVETPTETLFGDISQTLPESKETVEEIRADIGNCTRCPLHEGRTKIVHSTGNLQADLMFIGEAPGADEDQKGEPFVGRAGQLLNKIIEAIGMKREDVFIGNINRCRPPGNRAPTLPEAETCKPFLLREISVVRPKVIVVLGNTACQNLLNTKVGITKLRGNFQDYYGVKVMPTFHPAYLLRDPSKKRETWEDMKIVRDYLNGLK
ncbi:MAG: uracil-DNA glycosylase [Pyrinomonadaceae bacterium]|nr:uracil-DNA glycosylase [Pyrinomonadaceae bacterium]